VGDGDLLDSVVEEVAKQCFERFGKPVIEA